MALTLLCVTFVLGLLLGMPVVFAIGLSSLVTVFYEGLPIAVVFQRMAAGMNVFAFLTIPFFIFTGELMMYGGIADRIIRASKAMVGHVRGGLGMTNVVACTMFGGVSGSPVADVSAMGSALIPLMKREGIEADYAVNVTTYSSLVGALMPTSHNMIIYSLAAGGTVSMSSLIMAGAVPAAMLTVANIVAAYMVAVARRYPSGQFPGWEEVWRSLATALPGLFIMVIIVGGILSGVFTAAEAGAVAVAYALLLTIFVYRSLTVEAFLKAAAKAAKTTGVVLLLVGISTMFGYLMSLYGVAEMAGDALSSISTTPWVIFLLVNLALFIFGIFLDMAAHILVCTPIFLPIVMHYGMSPVQFGIIVLLNCTIGLNTPPVGAAFYLGCAIGEVSVGKVVRSIWPFMLALWVTLLIVTLVPETSMFVHDLLQ
ncbi:TRAP-type C4-dicarboxylate transport system, large permease component [Rhodovastum atsumiense]|uniref:TRAP transporter large permease protein n=1 Tax=Rhodovastum atsumiense TaxID=504468 RepID=A0A5M6IIP8_9PROT|nr:TRAP transporter large permease [Rhodovastum atsumiense]KAA5608143.1 TRAP transporter large permease [Rhodovastum atsumiense]CAH2599372.1 TRAP-type C4-dicarboxylate transport system, large permease component [Rhodovastum atsumiense]